MNDAGTVGSLISQAYSVGKQITENLEVIAIHGGASKDNTFAEILIAKGKYPDLVVLDHSANREGYAVIRHGFEAATKEWVFYTDGDGQYHLDDLFKLALQADGCDVVNGYKVERSDPWHRVLFGNAYQIFSRLLFRLPIRDIDCDFRLIRKRYLQDTQFISKGASILPELISKLQSAGAKFSEVPVRHYPRVYGNSNYTFLGLIFEKLLGDLKLFVKNRSSSATTPFQAMRHVEEKLWWYVALRERILAEIEKILPSSICDVGCGTGCLMQFLQEKHYAVQGIDISPIALEHCRKRGVQNVQQGSMTQIAFSNNSFDLALAIDVLCMLEKEEIVPAIQELKRILKPGGSVIFNQPAYNWMRSRHDRNCEMKKRFSKRECTLLLTSCGFEITQASYRVCLLFPLIAIVRLSHLFKTDLKIPPFNWLFLALQRGEDALLKRGYRLPFGSSVFLVARKSDE